MQPKISSKHVIDFAHGEEITIRPKIAQMQYFKPDWNEIPDKRQLAGCQKRRYWKLTIRKMQNPDCHGNESSPFLESQSTCIQLLYKQKQNSLMRMKWAQRMTGWGGIKNIKSFFGIQASFGMKSVAYFENNSNMDWYAKRLYHDLLQ